MDAKLLIDGIVQQTTVLIAQISTAAGLRAPLAHIADQVFVDLAREIEAQGVSRKVAADMFGLALRTYQKRIQRLGETGPARRRSLWEAVYEFVQAHPRVHRYEIARRFRYDADDDVGAVLSDLVQHGLVFATGRGQSAVYRAVDPEDRAAFLSQGEEDGLAELVWLHVYRHGAVPRSLLSDAFSVEAPRLAAAIDELLAGGQLKSDGQADPVLSTDTFVVEVGAHRGWEAAVFDHFSTVAAAIVTKLRVGTRSLPDDRVGGATHTFDVHSGHPMEAEVYALLRSVRAQVDALWERVSAHNRAHPPDEDRKVKVSFYFGQTVSDAVSAGAEEGAQS